jgi:hypothetical protein
MRRQFRLYLLAFGLLQGLLARPAAAQNVPVSQLVEISRPNAVGTCNTGFGAFGTWPTDNAEEPFVAVNPLNRNNFVAAWIQGPFQDIVAAVSMDGGQNWQRVPIPLTTCSGGPFIGTGDPMLSFAPNGDLYFVAITGNTAPQFVMTSKSVDGGLHWSAATPLPGSDTVDPPPDFAPITADPTDAHFAYVSWNGFGGSAKAASPGHVGSVVFTRTTNGGLTWEPSREIFRTGLQSFVQTNQPLVLPDGTVVILYNVLDQQPNQSPTQTTMQLLRSSDHGQTWSASGSVLMTTPLYDPKSSFTLVVDPHTGQHEWTGGGAAFTVDPRNGRLYATWEDGRFSNSLINEIAFSMSADGGFTWSAPIRVNQTPSNLPLANRQAFLPTIAVAANGTIGVTYYDFRFNSANPGLPTDRWLVQCHPSSASTASDTSCWGSEIRLTDTSFNMEAVSSIAFNGRPFLGDYFEVAAAGDGFVAVFTAVDNQNVTSIFARRVGP